jgi:tyrosyl-tRNA synthetase
MTTKRHFKPVDEQISYLRKGAAEIIREEDLRVKLESSLKTGKPLRVKLGVDPTAPDLHLGHTVVLRKLKHFQDLGHTAIFLVGDFTAMVGDPTGQSETRPPLTAEQVRANMRTYLEQVDKILDRSQTEVRYNSDWLGKLTGYDMIRLCAHYRLARMLEREDFRSRLAGNLPIAIHELLYPLLVAYDSVVLEADVELGATEQKFNLLIGRDIQREYGQPSQVALTMPILVGLDGKRKMSKSLGNYVGITEPPAEMFGKLMSISDEMMWTYYELLTDLPQFDINERKRLCRSGSENPVTYKKELAHTIVGQFHGVPSADSALRQFITVFSNRQTPQEMKEIVLKRLPTGISVWSKSGSTETGHGAKHLPIGPEKWSKLLVYFDESGSVSEAERVIKQGGFEINGSLVKDPTCKLDLNQPNSYEVRFGKKKFLRIVVE